MKNGKYFVVMFCNNKKQKIIYKCNKKISVDKFWEKMKKQKPPRFMKMQGGKRGKTLNFELGLIYPHRKLSRTIWKKDELGGNHKVQFNDERFSLKDLIPYWQEELIYDYSNKVRITYDKLLKFILTHKNLCQIFILNNKLFIQNEDDFRLFGNKNIDDAERLLTVLREDLIMLNRGNFIFVKDINTAQRVTLYNMLEEKGFSRSELVRHYSY